VILHAPVGLPMMLVSTAIHPSFRLGTPSKSRATVT